MCSPPGPLPRAHHLELSRSPTGRGAKSKVGYEMDFSPSLISWNLTERCNLACGHCYMDASPIRANGELSESECYRIIDEIAGLFPGAMLVLSGGEPLLHPDFLSIARRAASHGLVIVVGTNGTLLTVDLARQMAGYGVMGVGISVDSVEPRLHDSIRGMPGSWEQALSGVKAAQQAGLQVQIQATVMQANRQEVPELVEMASRMGVKAFNLFFLVCTGRGQKASDLSAAQNEELLKELVELQPKYPGLIVRARCAPHFVRLTGATDAGPGCMAGRTYCRITPQGEVTPCPYLPVVVGNLRRESLAQVWNTSPHLLSLRLESSKGKCHICEFTQSCGGCRARAYVSSGDYMAEDPYCLYQPTGGLEAIKPISIVWSPEARERMEKAPVFVRSMAMRMVERYAREHGHSVITLELMDELRRVSQR